MLRAFLLRKEFYIQNTFYIVKQISQFMLTQYSQDFKISVVGNYVLHIKRIKYCK